MPQVFSDALKNAYKKADKQARFFDKLTPVTLFRGLKRGDSTDLMQPTLIGFHLKRGPRKPDVLFQDGKGVTPQYENSDINAAIALDASGNLTRHVLANAGDYVVQGCRTLSGDHRGLSLFDKANKRLPFIWFCIPAGSKIPPGIAITRDSDDEHDDEVAIHYTAAPKDDMPLSLFLQHLKELAIKVEPA
jgi:ferredoxin-NADP reductase